MFRNPTIFWSTSRFGEIFDGRVELTLLQGDKSGCDFVIVDVGNLFALSIVGT